MIHPQCFSVQNSGKTRFVLLIIFLINCSLNLFATTTDTTSIESVNKAAVTKFEERKFEEALELALTAKRLAMKSENYLQLAKAHTTIGKVNSEVYHDHKAGLENFEKALSLYRLMRDTLGIYGSYKRIGILYNNVANYPRSIDHFRMALKFAMSMENNIEINTHMGHVYFDAQNYDLAVPFYQKQLENASNYSDNSIERARAYNNLANVYARMNDTLKTAKYYQLLNQVLNNGEDLPLDYFSGAKSNVGLFFTTTKEFDKAFDCLIKSYNIAKKLDVPELLAFSQSNLSTYYYEIGDFTKSAEYADSALAIAEKWSFNGIRLDLYGILGTISEQKGDYIDALAFYKKYVAIKDSVFNNEKSRGLTEVTMRYEIEEGKKKLVIKDLKLEKVSAEKSLLSAKKTFYLIGCLFLLIVGYLIFTRQKKIIRHNKELYDRDKKIKEDQQLKMSLELENTNLILLQKEEKLRSFINGFISKNKLINSIKSKYDDAKVKVVLDQKILTAADWKEFKIHFNNLYPNYLFNLMSKFEDLTSSEQRLFLLLKLKMSTDEIADVLGISPSSVGKTRLRLRKKLTINRDVSLNEFVSQFSGA